MFGTHDDIRKGIEYLTDIKNISKNEYFIPLEHHILCLTKLQHGGSNIRIRASFVNLVDDVYLSSNTTSLVIQIHHDLPARGWDIKNDIDTAVIKIDKLLFENGFYM